MTDNAPNFAAEVSAIQDSLGISKNRLSMALGLPRTHICQILAGKRKPSAETALRIQAWAGKPELAHDALGKLSPVNAAGKSITPRSDMHPKVLQALQDRFNLDAEDIRGWLGVSRTTVFLWKAGRDRIPQVHAEKIRTFDWNTLRFTSRVRARSPMFFEGPSWTQYHLKDADIPDPFILVRGLRDFYQPALKDALKEDRRATLDAVYACRRALLAWDDVTGNPNLQEAYEQARLHAESLLKPHLIMHERDYDYTVMED